MPRNEKTPWSDADITKLAELYFSVPKIAPADMAAQLGRSVKALQTEISRLGMARPGAKVRKCAPCKRPFYSWGSGNWICSRCKLSAEFRCAS